MQVDGISRAWTALRPTVPEAAAHAKLQTIRCAVVSAERYCKGDFRKDEAYELIVNVSENRSKRSRRLVSRADGRIPFHIHPFPLHSKYVRDQLEGRHEQESWVALPRIDRWRPHQ